MNRRHFLLSLAAGAPARAASPSAARIRRISLTPVEGRFHKFVAMNSYDKAPKGRTYTNTLVRIATDQGMEGVGVMEYAAPDDAFRQAARGLLGADPLAVYQMREGRITSRSAAFEALLARYPHLDGPLYDLIGKLTQKPCWKLIGEAVRERVEVYDGTLYFSDIWFRDRGVRAVVEEAEEAYRSGYGGMKFKIGRGAKWMDKEAGLRRDIDVVKAVRQALGPQVKILTDANNGHQNDAENAWRFLAETQTANVHWLEEPFPESAEHYTRLRQRMRRAGMKTLIADGENMRDPEQFVPYLKPARLLDVLQMDIRRGGFLDNSRMARMGEEVGAVSIPHNWGSQVGLFMGLHLARAVRSVTAAEDDRSTCDVIAAEGYRLEKGRYTVSDSPGLGIRVNEKVFSEKYRHASEILS